MVKGLSTHNPQKAIVFFARLGYAARGLVYLLVGGLATLAVFGEGGKTKGSRGALQWVLGAPLGDVLLTAIALGLIGYAMWRCIQAVGDPDNHGRDMTALAIRTSLMVSAITHTLLAIFAANLIFTFGSASGEGNGSQSLADWLMSQAYGRWLVGGAGLALIGAGIAHSMKGAKARFDRYFDMPERTQSWAYPLCRFGLMIRGLVFFITGGFFLIAAYTINPDRAGGMAEVFNTLGEQPLGQWLMAIVAIGLFAFGLYSLLEAIYRRVHTPL